MVKIEERAQVALANLLQQISIFSAVSVQKRQGAQHSANEVIARFHVVGGRMQTLRCEIVESGQPRFVRNAILRLQKQVESKPVDVLPFLIAPYLSPETQEMCRHEDVGYLDLEGNARLVFGSVYVHTKVDSKPPADRRELRSLFKPKSAQVLRVMLHTPTLPWRILDLAKVANVSSGLVSNVRTGLLNREWAHVSEEGIVLSDPGGLLDAWCNEYEPPAGKHLTFYTTLFGKNLEDAARGAMLRVGQRPTAAFASFSAAQWLAPYARNSTAYFYADEGGLDRLQKALDLTPAAMGENVVVRLLNDPELLADTEEPTPNAICTSVVQTYLDLANAGERGLESAEHLRRERLKW